jgi:glycosyltransferase involved in cell wall biosynthesis
LDNATGEYVIFLDSDDIYYENGFKLLYDAIINNEDVDYVRGRFEIDFKGYDLKFTCPSFYSSKTVPIFKGNPKTRVKSKSNLFFILLIKYIFIILISILNRNNNKKHVKVNIKDQKIKLTMLTIVSGIFKRDVIDKNNIRFHDWKINEDYLFTLEYLTKSSSKILVLNDEIIYNYIKDFQDKSSLYMPSNILNLPKGLIHYKKICDDNGLKTNILKILPLWLILFLKENLTTNESVELKKEY